MLNLFNGNHHNVIIRDLDDREGMKFALHMWKLTPGIDRISLQFT